MPVPGGSFALTVYASVNANPFKLERMRMLGATVVLHGEDFDEAKIEAKRVALAAGKRMVEDGFDAETGEGAGTIGIELAEWKGEIDAVLLPLGNGALACGVGRYLKEARPEIRVVAVQSAGAPAMLESWRRKASCAVGYDLDDCRWNRRPDSDSRMC